MEYNMTDHTYHIISELMKQITDNFINNFQENYFTRIYNTEVLREGDIDKDNNNLEKLSSPALSITPSYEYATGDNSMYKSFRNKKFISPSTKIMKFYDDNDFFIISVQFDNMEFTVDYKISSSSKAKQMNLEKDLITHFRCNDLYYEKIHTEMIIDMVVIERISTILSINIFDTDNKVNPVFLDVLNKVSLYPIKYKMNTTDSTMGFVFLIPMNVKMSYNTPKSSNEVKGSIKKHFITSLTLTATCIMMSAMYYKDNINMDETFDLIDTGYLDLTEFSRTDIQYLDDQYYRLEFDADYEPEFKDGVDSINVKSLLSGHYMDYMNSFDISDFNNRVKIIYFANSSHLIYGKDYTVEDGICKLNDPNIDGKIVYHMCIYMDRNAYNDFWKTNIKDSE